MASELFKFDKVFRETIVQLDDTVNKLTGISVVEKIYDARYSISDVFDNILFTHPAIFMIEYSLAQALVERGIRPDYLLGASLGEFTAAAVANAIAVDDALYAVVKQAELCDQYCTPSGMLAILAPSSLYSEMPVICDNSKLAGVNYETHFIVSGENEALTNIQITLRQNDILFVRLPVTIGFHSSHIDNARKPFLDSIDNIAFNAIPEIPIISCMHAEHAFEIKAEYLWNVVRMPIEVYKTFSLLKSRGGFAYIDLSPSGTMANFAKQNLKHDRLSNVYPIITPFGGEKKMMDKIILAVTQSTAAIREKK
jgi:bacillaene synthase trans-acting acyltransferase